jgi:hypothetical protein
MNDEIFVRRYSPFSLWLSLIFLYMDRYTVYVYYIFLRIFLSRLLSLSLSLSCVVLLLAILHCCLLLQLSSLLPDSGFLRLNIADV